MLETTIYTAKGSKWVIQKMFLLAQSYMPAQEIQLLKNPSNSNSPWYSISDNGILNTPEWTFNNGDLKQF